MTIPSTMTAIDPATPGGPEVLQPVTRPVPQPGHRLEAQGEHVFTVRLRAFHQDVWSPNRLAGLWPESLPS